MRRLALTAALSAGLLGCFGHPQQEGDYRLTLGEVVRDDCGLSAHPALLTRFSLRITGNVVFADSSFLGLGLVGGYLESSKINPSERFFLDGSAANVTSAVGGEECLLELVTFHLVGTTRDPTRFGGTMEVRFDTRYPDRCVCALQAGYSAQWQGP